MTNVLLLSSYGPYETAWGEIPHDITSSRLTRGQGPFNAKTHCHYWGLHMIAENLNCPVTVLEEPHWDEFMEEVDKGYDYVGIQLKAIHMDKVANMVRYVKENAPNSKVITGGYGVGALHDPVPGDDKGSAKYILDNSDYLCREEGVRFMRRVIGDDPVDRPLSQNFLPLGGATFPGFEAFLKIQAPNILVALGCPNGCEFCTTSAFFHQKKIQITTPKETYEIMKVYRKRLKKDQIMFSLFDEDFALDKDYVTELGKLIRSDESTYGFTYFSFGSMRSLAQYTFEELVESGFEAIWIGVESSLQDVIDSHHELTKRDGNDIKDTFDGLHKHGIGTTGSMILGFDFHTPENIEADIDYFVKLEPVNFQIAPLTPCPGTKLYRKLQEEGRIYDDYAWKDFNIWKDDVFKVNHFERGALRKWYDLVHVKLMDENGPAPQRMFDVSMQGYKTFKDTRDKYFRYKSEGDKSRMQMMLPMVEACIRHATGPIAKEKAVKLKEQYVEEFGEPVPFQNQLADYLCEIIRKRKIEMEKEEDPGTYEVPVRWTYYNGNKETPMVIKGREQKEPTRYKVVA